MTIAEGDEMGNGKYKPLSDAFGYLLLTEEEYSNPTREGFYPGSTLGQLDKELAMLRFVNELRKVL